jgi:hypothetical protein
LTLVVAGLVGMGVIGAWCSRHRSASDRELISVAALAFLFGVALIPLHPLYGENREPVAELTQAAVALSASHREPLVLYPASKLPLPTARYNADSPIEAVESPDELTQLVASRKDVRVISTEDALRPFVKIDAAEVLARTDGHVLAEMSTGHSAARRNGSQSADEVSLP